ncbi:hypothetical protein E2C01_082597 [Portunus trituberculatus]|uniref:Uncharacterized protein n=1 Tax=Portunus trituberculatus TaxID=210409 RepID=A0A5B7IYW0_PORTR|nr:hypothetical protein [Portunus trituberculatus]
MIKADRVNSLIQPIRPGLVHRSHEGSKSVPPDTATGPGVEQGSVRPIRHEDGESWVGGAWRGGGRERQG